ncbi:hypothetical protein [Actinoplanes couchii]|uniref:DUF306 domain-containing protein n=1 Tax=Actinoplanes couchii TaxID=403638 RepID=A0ABQ3XT31_9ACTN|nr:hypothetical protein [Actinoplanes couchii]MDR6324063.1 hypothetical protein [Actinoplanes couchii]GID61590.1 hypothetical protein Aco03nite_099940 [Actinoplanes couchii]
MTAQPGHPTRPRITSIARWVGTAVLVLIAALTLWVGWPKSPAIVPDGASEVEVYLIDDDPAVTVPAATGARSGWFGRLSLPCGVTSWYIESAGAAVCAWLDGPKGNITVTGEDGRITVPADSQKALAGWAAEWADGPSPTKRALLLRDGDPVGIVVLATPATAIAAS